MSRLIKDIVLYRLSAFIAVHSQEFALEGSRLEKKNTYSLIVW